MYFTLPLLQGFQAWSYTPLAKTILFNFLNELAEQKVKFSLWQLSGALQPILNYEESHYYSRSDCGFNYPCLAPAISSQPSSEAQGTTTTDLISVHHRWQSPSGADILTPPNARSQAPNFKVMKYSSHVTKPNSINRQSSNAFLSWA